MAKSKNISKFAATFTDFYENQNIEKDIKSPTEQFVII